MTDKKLYTGVQIFIAKNLQRSYNRTYLRLTMNRIAILDRIDRNKEVRR